MKKFYLPTLMKIITVLRPAAILLIIFLGINKWKICAQTIHFVPVPAQVTLSAPNQFAIYKNQLVISYFHGTDGGQLALFDATNISPIKNLDKNDRVNFVGNGGITVLNGNLYFGYNKSSNLGLTSLAKYNGSKISIIPFPDGNSSYYGLQYPVITFNQKLYFDYSTIITNYYQPEVYNGTHIDSIFAPAGNFNGVLLNPNAIIYDDNLYSYSAINTNGQYVNHLVQLKGNKFVGIDNPDNGKVVSSSIAIFNDKLYTAYVNADNNLQLAKFNGTTLTKVPNTVIGNADTYAMFAGIVYKGNLYFLKENLSTSMIKLVKFDGTKLTVFNNPDAAGTIVLNDLIIYNENLYLQYKTGGGVYKLGKFNGTKITLIKNPDAGLGVHGSTSPTIVHSVFNDRLYVSYVTASNKNELAYYYDKNTVITKIANPQSNPAFDNITGYVSSLPLIYKHRMYFNYLDTNRVNHLAYIDSVANPGLNAIAAIPLSNLPFKLSPNPANDYITITLPYSIDNAFITITGADGKTYYTSKQNIAIDKSFRIETARLIAGTYFLSIESRQNRFQQKFIKE